MMRKVVLISSILLLPFMALAQNQKASKEQKKEQKEQENAEKMQALYKIVESRQFVVEANQVFGNAGDVFDVMPSVNFFAVDSSYSTMQLSFIGIIGWNGIGGITSDGKLDKFELEELVGGKPITLYGSINSRSGGNVQFTMYVYSSGMANVTATGNWGNDITFQGRLFTLADSKVYKGIPTN
jgi:hypothetical protein